MGDHGYKSMNVDLKNPKAGRFENTGGYQDVVWMIFFYVHLIVVIGVAGWSGSTAYSTETSNTGGTTSSGDSGSTNYGKVMAVVVIGSTIAGAALAAGWLRIMRTCSLKTLIMMYVPVHCIWVVFLIYTTNSYIAAVIMAFCLLLFLFWLWLVRDRIPFAEAMLQTSLAALSGYSGPIYLSFALIIPQIVWSFIWITAAIGLYQKTSNQIVSFVLLISFFWGCEVIKNVGHTTTAGVVGTWWLVQNPADSPTWGALKRSLTTSFGSICLGSLIVAILKALRAIIRAAQQRARESGNLAASCMLCLLDCILSCIESIVEYFNHYAYTFVAIYGLDFISAGKLVYQLFSEKGFTMLINDDLTGIALVLGMLFCGLGGAIAGYFIGYSLYKDVAILSLFFGLLISMFIACLVFSVVSSAISTTFVVWASDPATMQDVRKAEFQQIKQAGQIHQNPEDLQ